MTANSPRADIAVKLLILFLYSDIKDIIWVTVNGFPVFDSNDALAEIVISFIEITKRRHENENLTKK